MEWISIDDSLPDEGVTVLWAREEVGMSGRKYIDPIVGAIRKGRLPGCMDWVYSTHWMPLPDPPTPTDDPQQ